MKKAIIRRLMVFFDKQLERLASLYFEEPMCIEFCRVNDWVDVKATGEKGE